MHTGSHKVGMRKVFHLCACARDLEVTLHCKTSCRIAYRRGCTPCHDVLCAVSVVQES